MKDKKQLLNELRESLKKIEVEHLAIIEAPIPSDWSPDRILAESKAREGKKTVIQAQYHYINEKIKSLESGQDAGGEKFSDAEGEIKKWAASRIAEKEKWG